jgi:hypothetical protein
MPFNIASSTGAAVVAAVPSPASRDAVFALVVGEPLQKSGQPSLDLTASLDSPAPVADQALTPAGAFGGQQSLDHLAPLTRGSSHGFRSERNTVGLLDSVLVGEENPASAMVTDSLFALLAADAPAGE